MTTDTNQQPSEQQAEPQGAGRQPMKRVFKPLITAAAMAALACAALAGCSDAPGATKVLEAHGFKDIATHGHSVFGCSEDDSVRTKFTATAPNGARVSGVVCAGLGPFAKGATVRLD